MSLVILLKFREWIFRKIFKNFLKALLDSLKAIWQPWPKVSSQWKEEFLDQSSVRCYWIAQLFSRNLCILTINFLWIGRLLFWRPWRKRIAKKTRSNFKTILWMIFYPKKIYNTEKNVWTCRIQFWQGCSKFFQKFLRPSSSKNRVEFLKFQFEKRLCFVKSFMGHGDCNFDNRTETSFQEGPKTILSDSENK